MSVISLVDDFGTVKKVYFAGKYIGGVQQRTDGKWTAWVGETIEVNPDIAENTPQEALLLCIQMEMTRVAGLIGDLHNWFVAACDEICVV